MTHRILRRIEPTPGQADLQAGISAEVGDGAWFLGRQWQMGEHRASNTSTPASARIQARSMRLQPLPDRAGLSGDPALIPPEAIIEVAPDSWWTTGRRVRTGRVLRAAIDQLLPTLPAPSRRSPLAAALADLADPTANLLEDLAPPYRALTGQPDGLALARTILRVAQLLRRLHPTATDNVRGLVAAAGIPPSALPSLDYWDPPRLEYSAGFRALSRQRPTPSLSVRGHRGGPVDWYTADAQGSWPTPAAPARRAARAITTSGWTTTPTRQVAPTPMRYPGVPHPRWWQIEDHRDDPGGYPPDSAHLATLFLLDTLTGHGDDWYTIPVLAGPTTPGADDLPLAGAFATGTVAAIVSVNITDSFDDTFTVAPHPHNGGLFRTAGLPPAALPLWPTAANPLTGHPPLEEFLLVVDQDADLVWAVETRAGGVATPSESLDPPAPSTPEVVAAGSAPQYRYRPSVGMRTRWHPFLLEGSRSLTRRQLAAFDTDTTTPPPTGATLRALSALDPAALPWHGLRVTAEWRLARATDGSPVLWVQRRADPLTAPPTSTLRFDAALRTAVTAAPPTE